MAEAPAACTAIGQRALEWLDGGDLDAERQIRTRLEHEYRAVLAASANPLHVSPTELLEMTASRFIQVLGTGVWDREEMRELAASTAENVLSVTQLLHKWKASDDAEGDAHLMELVHVELESIARRRLSRWPGLRTKVEPKELVSELFLRLRAYCPAEIWTNRAAFWAAVGTVLHRVLLDMSRPKTSSPPSRLKITIGDTADLPAARQEWDEVEFRLVLDRLEQVNRRQRQVLEFHLVMGIDQQEIADALGVSLSTVRRDLQLAQAWVRKRWLGVRVKE